jgi:hypothetical protein
MRTCNGSNIKPIGTKELVESQDTEEERKFFRERILADNGMPSTKPCDFVGASLRAAFPKGWIFPTVFAVDWYIHTF